MVEKNRSSSVDANCLNPVAVEIEHQRVIATRGRGSNVGLGGGEINIRQAGDAMLGNRIIYYSGKSSVSSRNNTEPTNKSAKPTGYAANSRCDNGINSSDLIGGKVTDRIKKCVVICYICVTSRADHIRNARGVECSNLGLWV